MTQNDQKNDIAGAIVKDYKTGQYSIAQLCIKYDVKSHQVTKHTRGLKPKKISAISKPPKKPPRRVDPNAKLADILDDLGLGDGATSPKALRAAPELINDDPTLPVIPHGTFDELKEKLEFLDRTALYIAGIVAEKVFKEGTNCLMRDLKMAVSAIKDAKDIVTTRDSVKTAVQINNYGSDSDDGANEQRIPGFLVAPEVAATFTAWEDMIADAKAAAPEPIVQQMATA